MSKSDKEKIEYQMGPPCKNCGHASGAHTRGEVDLDDPASGVRASCNVDNCPCPEYRE